MFLKLYLFYIIYLFSLGIIICNIDLIIVLLYRYEILFQKIKYYFILHLYDLVLRKKFIKL